MSEYNQNYSKNSATVSQRTRKCLQEINHNTRDQTAKLIILLGRTGVGKSSLLEHLTGANGHAGVSEDPGEVTTEIQIEISASDNNLYFMDTPGFDVSSKISTFDKIFQCLLTLKSKVTIIGVLHVVKINQTRTETIDRTLLGFLQEFCGDAFLPQVTFVSTFWSHPLRRQQDQCQKKKQNLWSAFVGKGVNFYDHGRKNLDDNMYTATLLDWDRTEDQNEFAKHSRRMISRYYGNITPENTARPRIVEDLKDFAPAEPQMTHAGRYLLGLSDLGSGDAGIDVDAGEPSESARRNANTESAPSQTHESQQSTPHDSNQAESTSTWPGVLYNVLSLIARNTTVSINAGVDTISRPFDPPVQSNRFSAGDPNSIVDIFNANGIDSSPANRDRIAVLNNISRPSRSFAQGDGLLRAYKAGKLRIA